MKTYLLVLVVIIFSSCSAERRMTRIAYNHEAAAASVCARFFPVKDSIVYTTDSFTKIKYIPGPMYHVNVDSLLSSLPKKLMLLPTLKK